MLRYVKRTASNVMCYVEGTPGSIMFVRETPVNIKMHYVLKTIGNMMCPMFQKF